MSLPFVSSLIGPSWLNTIPFAVLGASLLGSGHCAAMCGGLVLVAARDRKAAALYHLGRLIGYTGLGALAGALGNAVLGSGPLAWVSQLSSLILALGFLFLGVRLWQGKPLHLFRLPPSVWRKLSRLGPGATGLLSAFLPCGWLHAFVIGAVATRSAGVGALYLFFFWLGTLPALTLAPFAIKKIFKPMASRAPRLSAGILIAIGIGTLAVKMAPQRAALGCHCDEKAKITAVDRESSEEEPDSFEPNADSDLSAHRLPSLGKI